MGKDTSLNLYAPMQDQLDRIIAVIERDDEARAVLNQDADGYLFCHPVGQDRI